ncbi:MAG: hypothetical protein BWZ10_02203 [candidate division BRC1 bacterium ADurb.BinA364]|nr:MAG: hypothetical protein BWZ10_02203 [candidate division BRC1 bacterium ADurb.BinA364]
MTRQAIWEAILARRTYAITGDRIVPRFSINGFPMGAIAPPEAKRRIEIAVEGGGALDCVDVLKNNRLLRRFSETDVAPSATGAALRTKLHLELGWGEKGKQTEWTARFGISDGRITKIEPRFRGTEVVSPLEKSSDSPSLYHVSRWRPDGDRAVAFETLSIGHPNNVTNTAQGMCLAIEAPIEAHVEAQLNGRHVEIPLRRLVEGAYADSLGGTATAAFRFHRAPLEWEWNWRFAFEDEGAPGDVYYLRVRQKNDQWAWTSPIFLREP